jgi:hypothetical protein
MKKFYRNIFFKGKMKIRALWSKTENQQFFFKSIFGFSFLDIFKNVHFSKPNLLFGKNMKVRRNIYIKKRT